MPDPNLTAAIEAAAEALDIHGIWNPATNKTYWPTELARIAVEAAAPHINQGLFYRDLAADALAATERADAVLEGRDIFEWAERAERAEAEVRRLKANCHREIDRAADAEGEAK